MTTARIIISLALESMNRLSAGEALDADLAATCLRRLNAIVDDTNAGRDMTPQEQIITAIVTGSSFTVGAGFFAAINAGDEIVSMQVDGYAMARITMTQYNDIQFKEYTGRPYCYAYDGLSTVYLHSAASGNTVNLVAKTPFIAFTDLDTSYVLASGYQGYFSTALAAAMAPSLLGSLTPALAAMARTAAFNVQHKGVKPAVINIKRAY